MALSLKCRICELCDGFQFVDTTGAYNDPDNLGGYGVENTISEPADFDTYILKVWYPHSDLSGDPDYTVDLLTLPYPTPDSDFYFTWVISDTMMGIDTQVSGIWTFYVTGTVNGITYTQNAQKIFVDDITSEIDTLMLQKGGPKGCGCKKGCPGPEEAYMKLLTVKCGGVCDRDAAQAVIDQLYDVCVNC